MDLFLKMVILLQAALAQMETVLLSEHHPPLPDLLALIKVVKVTIFLQAPLRHLVQGETNPFLLAASPLMMAPSLKTDHLHKTVLMQVAVIRSQRESILLRVLQTATRLHHLPVILPKGVTVIKMALLPPHLPQMERISQTITPLLLLSNLVKAAALLKAALLLQAAPPHLAQMEATLLLLPEARLRMV
jgi:hypothetical protein